MNDKIPSNHWYNIICCIPAHWSNYAPHIIHKILFNLAASTSSGAQTNCKHCSTFVNDKLAALLKDVVSSECTRWALTNFAARKKARNEKHPMTQFQRTSSLAVTQLHSTSTCISWFMLEICKSNGDFCPLNTLNQFLCGVLRHMKVVNPGCLNFLDEKDS